MQGNIPGNVTHFLELWLCGRHLDCSEALLGVLVQVALRRSFSFALLRDHYVKFRVGCSVAGLLWRHVWSSDKIRNRDVPAWNLEA
jgi:hypothetical protein